jgi:hypothetical protein
LAFFALVRAGFLGIAFFAGVDFFAGLDFFAEGLGVFSALAVTGAFDGLGAWTGGGEAGAARIDSRGTLTMTGAETMFIFRRVEDLERHRAAHHQLALLVLGPNVEFDEVLPVLAVAIADAALAHQGVAGPQHPNELHRQAPHLRATGPIGHQLAQKAHAQRRRREHRRHALGPRGHLIDEDGVVVARRPGVASELHAVDGRLGHRRQLVTDAGVFEVELPGWHQLSLPPRTTKVRRERYTNLPS